jgi:hypothetical protein
LTNNSLRVSFVTIWTFTNASIVQKD